MAWCLVEVPERRRGLKATLLTPTNIVYVKNHEHHKARTGRVRNQTHYHSRLPYSGNPAFRRRGLACRWADTGAMGSRMIHCIKESCFLPCMRLNSVPYRFLVNKALVRPSRSPFVIACSCRIQLGHSLTLFILFDLLSFGNLTLPP